MKIMSSNDIQVGTWVYDKTGQTFSVMKIEDGVYHLGNLFFDWKGSFYELKGEFSL